MIKLTPAKVKEVDAEKVMKALGAEPIKPKTQKDKLQIPDFSLGLNLVLAWPGCGEKLLDVCCELASKNAFWITPEKERHPSELGPHLEYIKGKADISQLPVVILSFSPVVANFFRGEPERVFVKKDNILVPITDFLDKVWLSSFSLGDLYVNGEFEDRTKSGQMAEK